MKKILFLALLAFTLGLFVPEAEANPSPAAGTTTVAQHHAKKQRKHRKQQRKQARHLHKVAFGNHRLSV